MYFELTNLTLGIREQMFAWLVDMLHSNKKKHCRLAKEAILLGYGINCTVTYHYHKEKIAWRVKVGLFLLHFRGLK